MTIRAEFAIDDAPVLVLAGEGRAPERILLSGPRADVAAEVEGSADGWRATLRLEASRWGGPVLPLPVGDYELTADGEAPDVDAVPLTMLGPIRAEVDGTTVRIGPPIDPAYDSGEGQAALERRYATRPDGLENAAFFESRLGLVAGGDPLAIDRELARRAPGVTRYWSVVDLSVAVPEGAVPVVEGSPVWWRARGAARLLVVDDWLRRRFVRSAGQVVLQTWHGSPPRRLGLRLPGWNLRRAAAVVRESLRWNVLVAQSPFAAHALSRGYAFNRTVWIEGGPRNDALVAGGTVDARAVLGIDSDEQVLLYAVLDPQTAARVDAAALAKQTGAVVLRVSTAPTGGGASPRVFDVQDFPDAARLVLAADALVTDRSTLMFDHSVTGKPMFFVRSPVDGQRSSVVDLGARAPGPVAGSTAELAAAIARFDPEPYAARYAQWRAVFNQRDDGRAAERVVARILDQGFVER
jgi:CDP-glycerol glycerophosphotransferase